MPEGKSEYPEDLVDVAERTWIAAYKADRSMEDTDPAWVILQALLAEREACAKIADAEADKLKLRDGPDKRRDPLNKQIVAMKVVCRDIASAIRNRPSSTEER